jgi:hypothetical protein
MSPGCVEGYAIGAHAIVSSVAWQSERHDCSDAIPETETGNVSVGLSLDSCGVAMCT